jgi:hypothetical protein
VRGFGEKARVRCLYQTAERRFPNRLRTNVRYHVRRNEGFPDRLESAWPAADIAAFRVLWDELTMSMERWAFESSEPARCRGCNAPMFMGLNGYPACCTSCAYVRDTAHLGMP